MKYFTILFFFFLPLYSNGQIQEECAITEFSINGIYSVIDYDDSYYTVLGDQENAEDSIAFSIYLYLPPGTDLSELSPQIKVSEGARIEPASGKIQDFESEDYVQYTVTDNKGNKRIYHVTARIKDKPEILSFTFNHSGRTISPYNRTYNYNRKMYFNLPKGANLKSLKPYIVLSEGSTISPSPDIPQDFSKPVEYILTDESGERKWTTVYVSNFRPKIDNIDKDTISIGDTVTIRGSFGEEGNEIYLAYDGNYGNYYERVTKEWPVLKVISESDSLIKVIIPFHVIEDTHAIKVIYHKMDDYRDIMVLNPKKPVIESIDKQVIRLGIDSLVIKGQNLHNIKAILISEVGNLIGYNVERENENGTEIILKTPTLEGDFTDSETFYISLMNEYSVCLEKIAVVVVMKEEDLRKYAHPASSFVSWKGKGAEEPEE